MADGSDTEDADSAAAVLVGNTDSAAPTLVTLISHVSMLSMLWLCIIYLNAMHLHDIYLHIILVPHSHESVDMIPLTFFLCRSHTVRHGFYKFCTSLELFFSRRCLEAGQRSEPRAGALDFALRGRSFDSISAMRHVAKGVQLRE